MMGIVVSVLMISPNDVEIVMECLSFLLCNLQNTSIVDDVESKVRDLITSVMSVVCAFRMMLKLFDLV